MKAVLDTLDELPEELRAVASLIYREDGGKFRLNADDLGDAGRRAIEHERRQRADAIRAREALEAKLAELQAKIESAPAGDGDGAAAKEAERVKRAYDERLKSIEAKLQAAEEQRQQAENKLADSTISDALRAAALELGVPKESVEDLIQLPRFRSPWKLVDGAPVPLDGELPRFDPESPNRTMSAKSYVREYLKDNKHWLPPSNGGAAPGGPSRATGALGQFTLTAEQAKNVSTYRAAKEAAAKVGAEVQIIE